MPICFLFLVKEIGFVLGLLVLVIIAVDILADQFQDKKHKFTALGAVLLTGAVLFVLRGAWMSHVTAMGFTEFHNAINWESIKQTLYFFSDETIRKGVFIVLKEAFIGPADRLGIPYLIWYILLAFLWVKIFRTIAPGEKKRVVVFSIFVLASFLTYGFLLYCLQIIVFHVGRKYNETIGFTRYLNILFSPVACMVIIVFFHRLGIRFQDFGKRIFIPLICGVILILGISRVEVNLHRNPEDEQIRMLSKQIESKVNRDTSSVGIVAGNLDSLSKLKFLYYLLPHKTDYKVRRFSSQRQLETYLSQYDYLVLFHPESQVFEWLNPYLKKESQAESISLFSIRKNISEHVSKQKILLERIFL